LQSELGKVGGKKMKINLRTLVGLIISISLIAISFGGCAKTEPAVDPNILSDYSISLFYVNDEYVQTGDDVKYEPLMPVYEMKINTTKDTLALDILNQLKIVPDLENYGTMVTDQIEFLGVTMDGDTAMVDFSSVGLSGSSTQESLIISQILSTLFLNFPDINQVQFLVDGQIAESLMGHIGASEPFLK
jgi:hypothetical protein